MCARFLLTSLLITVAVSAWGEERVLFDFEPVEFSWKGQGDKIEASRAAVLGPLAQAGSPTGAALDITTKAAAVVACLRGKVPRDWRGFKEISFWIYRSAEEARRTSVTAFEVQLYEEDGKTRFWKKSEYAGTGWQKVTLPLKWFRPGEGRIARWDRIDRMAFFFREAARVQIDLVGVATGDDPLQSSQPSEPDLRELAFPSVDPRSILTASKKDFLILSNAKDLEIDKLADQLTKVVAAVQEDFPFLTEQVSRPVLLVFATREEYEAFPSRLAERLGAQAATPRSGGYTLNGIATSFWDPQQGSLRPVYTHEFVHSLMDRTALLPNRSEWFQEGLATRYQLKFQPQANLPQIIGEGLEDSNLRLPIETLTSGKRIPLERYWQALLVVEFLLAGGKLPAVFAEFQKAGSTDLNPLFGGKVIPQDVASFTSDWAAWSREKYK